MDRATALPEGVSGPAVFRDGFGARYLGFDPDVGDPIEVLVFDSALVKAAEFGSAVGVRVARVGGARHTLFARVRRIDRPTSDSLMLVSDRVSGWRLADVLDISNRVGLAIDISAALNLMRQLVPAVALFGRHQRDLSIGNIAPERLILTPQGRLVLAEYVLGDGIDKLALSRDDLWRTFRVPVDSNDASRDAGRSDVLAIGLVALSLLVGRRLREDEFPFAVGDLLELVTEKHDGDARPLSAGLAAWLARALQLEGHKPLKSPKEAQVAFEEMLATERDYVTSPARLEAFIAQFDQRAGPPPEPSRPVAEKLITASPPAEPEPPPKLEPEPERETETAPSPLEFHQPRAEQSPAYAPPPQLDAQWASSSSKVWSSPIAAPAEPPDPVAAIPSGHGSHDTGYRPSELALDSVIPPAAEPIAEVVEEAPPTFSSISVPETSTSNVVSPTAAASETTPPVVPLAIAADQSPSWMTKALGGLALMVVLEAAAIFWLWNRSAAALLREGELSVQSRPPAARVILDDDELGVTPLTTQLAPGTYTLKVQAGNAEPRVIVVQIRAGVQTAQYLELQSGK